MAQKAAKNMLQGLRHLPYDRLTIDELGSNSSACKKNERDQN